MIATGVITEVATTYTATVKVETDDEVIDLQAYLRMYLVEILIAVGLTADPDTVVLTVLSIDGKVTCDGSTTWTATITLLVTG